MRASEASEKKFPPANITYQTEIINKTTTFGANTTYQTELINTAPKISLKLSKRIGNCTPSLTWICFWLVKNHSASVYMTKHTANSVATWPQCLQTMYGLLTFLTSLFSTHNAQLATELYRTTLWDSTW